MSTNRTGAISMGEHLEMPRMQKEKWIKIRPIRKGWLRWALMYVCTCEYEKMELVGEG